MPNEVSYFSLDIHFFQKCAAHSRGTFALHGRRCSMNLNQFIARGSCARPLRTATAGATAPPDAPPAPQAPTAPPEIDRYLHRLTARGMRPHAVYPLAERLLRRDREGDDRRHCQECARLSGPRCGKRLAVLDVLWRCDFFTA
jgi:hypothetical protein